MKFIVVFLTLLSISAPAQANRVWSAGAELQSATAAVEFETINGSPAVDTTTVRSGAASIRCNVSAATCYLEHRVAAADGSPWYLRGYYRFASFPAGLTPIMQMVDSANVVTASIRVNSNGTLELWDDAAGTQSGVDSSAMSTGIWYRIELKINAWPNGGAGYLDGTEFATDAGFNNGENTDRVRFGVMSSATMDVYLDDIAVNDGNGTNQTGLSGAGSIVYMQPNAAGDNNGCSAGDYTSVDEITPDNGTTICVLDAINDILDVNMESSSNAGIGASDTITLVQVGIRFGMASAAAATHITRVKSQSAGTVVSGSTTTGEVTAYNTHDDTAGSRQYKLTSYTDPQAGGAWTPALLDTAQIGVTTSDATPDVNVSTLWNLVEYVPAAAAAVSNLVPPIFFESDE